MSKRKVVWKEDVVTKKMKMLETTQCIVEKCDNPNLISSVNAKQFNFKLTEKTAKANLIKAANRNLFEIEAKQTCKNLRFSAGAYLHSTLLCPS